ncbi:MAG: CNNM domain-containing protein [Planctomycetota bacterium]
MDGLSIILLLTLPLLVLCSGLFSGSETALFSLTPPQRARLAKTQSIAAQSATRLLQQTRALLVTLLISNMLINVLYFTLSTLLLDHWLDQGKIGGGLAAGGALATLLGIIVFGEVLPKQIAAQKALAWSTLVAVPLLAVHRVIGPVRAVAQTVVITPLARLIAPPNRPPELSPDELETMLTMSRRRGVIDQNEQQLLQQVLELGQIKVRDLMVPRVDIRGHDIHARPTELLELAKETRLKHLPVYDGSMDLVLGLARSRRVVLDEPDTAQAIRDLLTPVHYVPEIATGDQLLAKMREAGVTFAIVVDEYGGTAGLVTLENVVEHIVGDIPGAFEAESEPVVEQLRKGVFRVGAELSVHQWDEWFGRNPVIMKAAGDAATLGGVVLGLLGRLPGEGEAVVMGNVVVSVERVQGRRIESLIVALSGSEPITEGKPDA